MLSCYIPSDFHYKALHVVAVFSLVEYDMCLRLSLFIATTQPDCCSDGRFEDYPREFDEF
jgi:hypothetical protein